MFIKSDQDSVFNSFDERLTSTVTGICRGTTTLTLANATRQRTTQGDNDIIGNLSRPWQDDRDIVVSRARRAGRRHREGLPCLR